MARSLVWLALALSLGGCGEGAAPRIVVLVSIDTLRADHLGLYGYARKTSPVLDALAAQGQPGGEDPLAAAAAAYDAS